MEQVCRFQAWIFIARFLRWGHPHSTYAQRGRGEVTPNAYDSVQGGRGEGVSRLRTYAKKNFFFDQKISKLFFFCTKDAIHYQLLLRIGKCKSTLSFI